MQNFLTYKINDLAHIAKRENNTKRSFLLVNPMQGKHIPVSPSKSLKLFKDLADKLYLTYPNEKLLIIGFAETATAIGASIACYSPIDTYYIQTTREIIPNADYLFFSETHSHATEQKLVKNDLATMIKNTDRIIFAEDEVTTGNTILSIIKLIEKEYSSLDPKFGIVSILNGMSETIFTDFSKNNIECTCLIRLTAQNYDNILSSYNYDESLCHELSYETDNHCTNTTNNYLNSRLGVNTKNYLLNCQTLASNIIGHFKPYDFENKKILVLGTEEFMFPAMYVGYTIEKKCNPKSVYFHATTRSPILPSKDKNYPIFSRYELRSVYDNERITFIYNLTRYDKVIIIHESTNTTDIGLSSLISALKQSCCSDITIFKWGE